jgi:nucleoside 2-deoxyribosyltransferase
MPGCIVCENQGANSSELKVGDFTRFDCPRCGIFELTHSAESALEGLLVDNQIRRSLMSHALRKMHGKPLRKIAASELPDFWHNERLPTPQQQADNLILWIGDNQETPFRAASIDRSALAAWIGLPISLPHDTDGWIWLHNQLEVKQLYQVGEVRQGRILDLKLSMYGWEKYEQLKKTEIASRTAFMAMKFGQRDVSDAVEKCFEPAVKRTGFVLRLVTHGQTAGSIDDQIRAGIIASRFVIADLTHGSPGAYWEAGFGEGLGRPVIYTCEKTAWEQQGTHFDTNHLTHIIWDSKNLTEAENRLVATIRATFRADAKQTDD